MNDFRQAIAARPEEFLTVIGEAEKKVGMPITAACYKRPKVAEDTRLAPYFAWKKQIGCIRHEDFGPNTFSPELADRVAAFFAAMMPVYEYFNRFKV